MICPHCGSEIELPHAPKAEKARSFKQLQRHFAILRAAYRTWPEGHSFKPKTEAHLRYWTYMQTGHFEVMKTIDVRKFELPPDELGIVLEGVLNAALRCSDDEKQFIELDGPLIIIKRTPGASYRALQHLSACKAFDAVDELLVQELRIESVEQLLEEAA